MTDATNNPEIRQPAVTPESGAIGLAAEAAPARVVEKTTHPVRGVLWGIVFGLGLTIVTIVTTIIQLSLGPAVVVFLVGIAVGTLWSMFGPAKAAPASSNE